MKKIRVFHKNRVYTLLSTVAAKTLFCAILKTFLPALLKLKIMNIFFGRKWRDSSGIWVESWQGLKDLEFIKN